ncbi:MAG: two-component regulator propeller domain-containing protein [Spirochaetia bacterium]
MDVFTREDGLGNSSVSSIGQDSYGFIWFGTQGGLNRYDGRSFTKYTHDPYDSNSLPHNLVQTLYVDDDDIIWVGTYSGLSSFNPNTGDFTNYRHNQNDPESLSNNVVVSITKDNEGNIWVGTLDGLNKLDPETGEFQRFYNSEDDPATLSNNIVRSLFTDSRGDVWVGTLGGLDLYHPETDAFTHYRTDPDTPTSLPGDYVMRIIEERPGILWVGTWGNPDAGWPGAVSRFDIYNEEFENYELPVLEVYSLVWEEKEDTLWAGTWGGGFFSLEYPSGEVVQYNHDSSYYHGPENDIAYSLFLDDSGLLWVGTNGGGVGKRNPLYREFVKFEHDPENPESIGSGKVNALYIQDDETLWAGLYNSGVDRINLESGEVTHYTYDADDPNSISNNIVTTIYEDSTGALWVTTNRGLNRYEPEIDGFSRPFYDDETGLRLSDEIIYTLMEDRQGRYWIGTYNSGIDLYYPEEDRFEHFFADDDDPHSLSDNLIYQILQTRDGEIWIGTNRGLNRYRPETNDFQCYFFDPEDPSQLSNNTIRDLFEDSRGRLWIGTSGGGVNLYDEESDSFVHYTIEDGLLNNMIININEDNNGNIWLATHYGLAVLDPEYETIETLDEDDGIENMEFTPGHAIDSLGNFYLGSHNIINYVVPAYQEEYDYMPPVWITGIRANNQELELEQPPYELNELTLSHTQNYLYIDFVSLDYLYPEQNRYMYRMEGLNNEWIYLEHRNFVEFPQLQPGNYVFHVRGTNSAGEWTDLGDQLRISITPPPWRSVWAFILYGGAAVFIFYLMLELRTSIVMRRKIGELQRTQDELRLVNEQFRKLSIQDPLTGAANRRYLESILDIEWRRATRNRTPIAFLLIDIDYFKAYNDNYGHQSGDECLQKVVECLMTPLKRGTETFARYGGEEFLCILPSTDEKGAYYVAEQMRKAVESAKIPNEYSYVAGYVTVSIGVSSTIPDQHGALAEWIKRADQAMYTAKHNGRNRVEKAQ